jgi:hypothetical protein
VVLAYSYLLSALIGLAWGRLRRRGSTANDEKPKPADASDAAAESPS